MHNAKLQTSTKYQKRPGRVWDIYQFPGLNPTVHAFQLLSTNLKAERTTNKISASQRIFIQV